MEKPAFPQHDKKLTLEYRSLAGLSPAARNPRTHSSAQIAQLAASITEFGWTNPILIDEHGQIIAGHGRVQAAQALGMQDVATITLHGLTAAQKRALVLADNKLALNAGWDESLLRIELAELKDEAFDISMIGFSAAELADIFSRADSGLTDPDDAPELPVEAVSKAGDVWLLDRHRLVCGDSTDPSTVDRALGAIRPHLMVTDPPYGVDYDPAWRNRSGMSASRRVGRVANDDSADWRAAYALFPGEVGYVWHASLKSAEFAESLIASGFELRAQIIWAKDQLQISRGHYHWRHEPCWYAVRKGATGHWCGDRKQTTLWEIASRGQDAETMHGTQKPVECMRRPMVNNSSPGQAIYDPFVGSGTTIIAAEMTGRACIGIEIAPQDVDVAVRRWQQFTGRVATLEATGEPFPEALADAA